MRGGGNQPQKKRRPRHNDRILAEERPGGGRDGQNNGGSVRRRRRPQPSRGRSCAAGPSCPQPPPSRDGACQGETGASRGSRAVLELLGDGGDLLDAVLVRGQVALEGLVLADEGFDVGQRGRLVVLLLQQGLLAWGRGAVVNLPATPAAPSRPAPRPTLRRAARSPSVQPSWMDAFWRNFSARWSRRSSRRISLSSHSS